MLKQLFFLFILYTGLASGNEKPLPFVSNNRAIVKGHIHNHKPFTPINLSCYLNEIAGDTKTTPDINGNFEFTLQLQSEFEFILSYDRSFSNLLINPGDSIFVSIDTKENTSFKFSGTNSKFLNDLYDINKIVTDSVFVDKNKILRLKEDKPEQYLIYRTVIYNQNLNKIKDILNQKNASKKIVNYFELKFRVRYGSDMMNYLNMSSIYQSYSLTKANIPDQFIKTVDSIYTESISGFGIREYHNFINWYAYLLGFEIRDSLIHALKNKDKLLATRLQMDYCLAKFSDFQKDYLVTLAIRNLINSGYINHKVYNKYVNEVSNDIFQSFLNKKYNKYKLTNKSKLDSSKIHLIDLSKSGSISLFDVIRKNHKGKTLYIDIWGTWCGPCISKFAYLPEFRKSLGSNDIDFLFLAVKSPKPQWEKTIKQHTLEGFHYLLNNKQKLELYSKLNISGIPHYFIINKNGDIVIPNAKAPDDDNVKEQLKPFM